MLRGSLTSVLMALLTLPQGICLCHYLEAVPAQSESTCCCETEEPTESTPGDLPDDHDPDCACKLGDVLASNPVPVSAEAFDFVALLSVADFLATDVHLPNVKQSTHFRSLDISVPLILCALRI